jgi:hypothetical protein
MIILTWLIFCVALACFAPKGSGVAVFFISFLFSPIVGAIALAIAHGNANRRERETQHAQLLAALQIAQQQLAAKP